MLTENVYTFIEEAGRKALMREDCFYFGCLLDFAEKLIEGKSWRDCLEMKFVLDG